LTNTYIYIHVSALVLAIKSINQLISEQYYVLTQDS